MWLFGETGALKLSDMWGQRIEFFGTANNLSYSAYRELDTDRNREIISSTEFMSELMMLFTITLVDPKITTSLVTFCMD